MRTKRRAGLHLEQYAELCQRVMGRIQLVVATLLIAEVHDMVTADWTKKTSDVSESLRRQWRADRALRPAMRSPGRPQPSRAVLRQFWRIIATGVTTADAAAGVGVSWPVGVRWFRHAGGMAPLSLDEPTGRYLSFTELGSTAGRC